MYCLTSLVITLQLRFYPSNTVKKFYYQGPKNAFMVLEKCLRPELDLMLSCSSLPYILRSSFNVNYNPKYIREGSL